MQNKVREIKRFGLKAKGKGALLAHLAGKRLTRQQAIEAKCYDCEGYYQDGRASCLISDCPLRPYNPHNEKQVIT